MIRVSISSLGSLLVCCTVGAVLLAWFWSESSDGWKIRRFERRRRKCSLCFFEFLTAAHGELVRALTEDNPPSCPRCGAPANHPQNEL